MLLLRRVYVVGGLLLAVGIGALSLHKSPPKRFKLVLDVEREARCYYETAWNDGEPVIGEQTAASTIIMARIFEWQDNCTWQATETLVPTGPSSYRYQYEEHPLHCMQGFSPVSPCSSIGTVTAVPLPEQR